MSARQLYLLLLVVHAILLGYWLTVLPWNRALLPLAVQIVATIHFGKDEA